MCVYIDINSHIYIHSVYKHSYCVAYVILYIHSIILLYVCLLCDFLLENATTNAHGLQASNASPPKLLHMSHGEPSNLQSSWGPPQMSQPEQYPKIFFACSSTRRWQANSAAHDGAQCAK